MKKKLIGVLFALTFICVLSLAGSVCAFAEESNEVSEDKELKLNRTELTLWVYPHKSPISVIITGSEIASIRESEKELKKDPDLRLGSYNEILRVENSEGKEVKWYSTNGIVCNAAEIGRYKGLSCCKLYPRVNGKCKIVAVVDGKELVCDVTVERRKYIKNTGKYKIKAFKDDLFKSNGEINPKFNHMMYATKDSKKTYKGVELDDVVVVKYDKTLKNGKIRFLIKIWKRWIGSVKVYKDFTRKEAEKLQGKYYKITKNDELIFGFRTKSGEKFEKYKLKSE